MRRPRVYLTQEAQAELDKLEREICLCTHARILHGAGILIVRGGSVISLAAGHGQCHVGRCPCSKLSWAHENVLPRLV